MSTQTENQQPQAEAQQEAPKFVILPKVALTKVAEYLGKQSYFEVAEVMALLSQAQEVQLQQPAPAQEGFGPDVAPEGEEVEELNDEDTVAEEE